MGNALRELIKAQTLDIDNHHQGDGLPITFGSGIHVHKRMNNSSTFEGVEFLIPLDTSEKYFFRWHQCSSDNQIRLQSEIKRALRNKTKRHNFVKDVLLELERKATFRDDTERLESLYTTAKNIMRHFGLTEAIAPVIKNEQEIFESIHVDEEGKPYYLLQDLKGNTIHIGDSKDFVENWKNIDWS